MSFPISEREYLHFAEQIKQHEEEGRAKNEPELQMILADGSTYKYRGHFYVANRQVNVQTGTILIQGIFPNPDYILRPGLYAKIRVGRRYRARRAADSASRGARDPGTILRSRSSAPTTASACARSRPASRRAASESSKTG